MENFLEWNIQPPVSPGSYITVSPEAVDFSLQRTDGDVAAVPPNYAYLWKDFGVNGIWGDFGHAFDLMITGEDYNGLLFWMVSNDPPLSILGDRISLGCYRLEALLVLEYGGVETFLRYRYLTANRLYNVLINKIGNQLTCDFFFEGVIEYTLGPIIVPDIGYQYAYIARAAEWSAAGSFFIDGMISNFDVAADPIPPDLSDGYPAGALPSGTTSVETGVTSSEPSEVRFAYSDVPFDDMTMVMSTDDGITHSAIIEGLQDGQDYDMYVRARDIAGNDSLSYFIISFSVSVPDTVPPVISGAGAINIRSTSARIEWGTDKPASSLLTWGLLGIPVNQWADPELKTDYVIELTGLIPESIYEYTITAFNIDGYSSVFGPAQFTTRPEGGIEDADLRLIPLFEQICVYSNFVGTPVSASLYFKESESSLWWESPKPVIDTREELWPGMPNIKYRDQCRGVVFWLKSRTAYDIRLDYIDTLGQELSVSQSITTRDDDPPSLGEHYFVSPNGNNAGAGDEDNPWATIQYGIDNLVAGNVLNVMPGTYLEGSLLFPSSGEIDNYVAVQAADPGNKPLIDGQNGHGACFGLRATSYVRVNGINMQNFNTCGVRGERDGNFNIIQHCRMYNCGSDWGNGGINLGGYDEVQTCEGWLIEWNEFVRDLVGRNQEHAIMGYLKRDYDNGFVIRHNRIIGNFKDAISSAHGADGTVGRWMNTMAHDNYIEDLYDDAIEMEGSVPCCAFWDNTMNGKGRMACIIGLSPVYVGPLWTCRNIAMGLFGAGSASAFKMGEISSGFAFHYHNSFANESNEICSANFIGTSGSVPQNMMNHVFKNNACNVSRYFYEQSGASLYDLNAYDYNCYFTRAETRYAKVVDEIVHTWADFRAARIAHIGEDVGCDEHSRFADPLFVDRLNGDFRLLEGSPCIDAGEVIVGWNDHNSPWSHSGAAPDIGAIEAGVAPAPSAEFIAEPTSGNTPLTVQFTDLSIGSIISWSWDFGDGASSADQSPQHTYIEAGSYVATLTIEGPGGSDAKSVTIVATGYVPPPVAAFAVDNDSGPAPHTVQFTDQSTGEIESWSWAFGDGSSSLAPSPGHTYLTAGTYVAVLTVTGPGGSDSVQISIQVTRDPVINHTVTLSVVGEGTTIPPANAPQTIADGASLEISATHAPGWVFNSWEGDVTGAANPLTIAEVTTDLDITAVFIEGVTPQTSTVPTALIVGIGIAGLIAMFIRDKK